MKCPSCQVTKLISSSSYFDRKKITIGNFCPKCLQFQSFSKQFDKKRSNLLTNQNIKPKFSRLKKQRMACPYCVEKVPKIINRKKWTIRKNPKKKDETPSWKCTCKICGNIWTQNTSNEFHLIDPNQKNYVLGF
jgi:hypothetical protein